jgi:type III secretory pathway component EscV
MSRKARLLTAVVALGLIDALVPFFPILAFIIIYVIVDKPTWFLEMVRELYKKP